ncbi:hypothetical protein WJX74_010749 [Apatococcus lobatus]|uniref:Uncharacterized protein n=1 Tax=Apatococcus lobatus TaxID=904363 RepID=A0AAW1SFX3_9CHLO
MALNTAIQTKRNRQDRVRQLLRTLLGDTPYERPVSWGTPALIRTLLTITYDGCVELFLRAGEKELYLAPLEHGLRAIVPGLVIGWGDDTMTIALPGVSAERARLMLVEEAMLETAGGPRSTAPDDAFTRTLATIWLNVIDATDPWTGCVCPPGQFSVPPLVPATMPSCAFEPCGKHAPVHSPHRAHYLVFCSRACRQAHLRAAGLPDPDRPDRVCCVVS